MLLTYLKNNNIHFVQQLSLADLTTFRIGGKAELIIYPDTIDKMVNVISYMYQNQMEYFVMGNGSNLLFSDDVYTRPIVKTDRLNSISHEDGLFTFESGVKLVSAANYAASLGYTGMEFAHGIPGSVGGAIYMNAGAYDGNMQQIVKSTRYIDETGTLHTISDAEHDFSYRHSFFSGKNCVVVSTTVELSPGNIDDIKAKMADLMQRRRDKQPLSLPSAGSTFKRPQGAFAGQLIEQCGLRGYQIGGARISDKHCGFVVNQENASCQDVLDLIAYVQKVVKEQTGYFLECEVEIVK